MWWGSPRRFLRASVTVLESVVPIVTDDSDPARTADESEDSLEDRIRRLHRHLEATAELPIDRQANRWLGEADAIARDVATSDLEDDVVVERVEKIQHLLSEVDETGHEEGNERLEAATRCCEGILEGAESN